MLMAGRPVMLVHARIRPSILSEFKRWYGSVHVPHVLAIPGVIEYRALLPGPRALPGTPNVLSAFVFEDESVIQKALRSPEAALARRDWERWSEHVRGLSIQIYSAFDAHASVRHLN
jgi:uncharacterized protein (TIGR02118 family)